MTFKEQLDMWLTERKIKKEEAHQDQIDTLLEKAAKDIKVSKANLVIDLETSYALAYNSMLKAGRALVLSQGYRTTDGAQHKTTVDFCGHFIDVKALVSTFDHMRRDRNTLMYDPFDFDTIEEETVLSAIKSAEHFLKEVKKKISDK